MVNFCAGFGILLTTLSVVLLIISNVAQINGTLVPRQLALLTLNTEGFLDALSAANDLGITNLTDVYAPASKETSTREGNHDGLRESYSWGLWSYCAGADDSVPDYCTPRAFGARFQPAATLLADLPEKYAQEYNATIPANIFTEDGYLGMFTHASSLLAFAGAVAVGLGWLTSMFAFRCMFVISALLQLVGALCLAVSAVVYTIIASKVIDALKDVKVQGVSIGLALVYGKALWILWAAAIASVLAVVPLSIACCLGRSDEPRAKKGKGKKNEKNAPGLYPY